MATTAREIDDVARRNRVLICVIIFKTFHKKFVTALLQIWCVHMTTRTGTRTDTDQLYYLYRYPSRFCLLSNRHDNYFYFISTLDLDTSMSDFDSWNPTCDSLDSIAPLLLVSTQIANANPNG